MGIGLCNKLNGIKSLTHTKKSTQVLVWILCVGGGFSPFKLNTKVEFSLFPLNLMFSTKYINKCQYINIRLNAIFFFKMDNENHSKNNICNIWHKTQMKTCMAIGH